MPVAASLTHKCGWLPLTAVIRQSLTLACFVVCCQLSTAGEHSSLLLWAVAAKSPRLGVNGPIEWDQLLGDNRIAGPFHLNATSHLVRRNPACAPNGVPLVPHVVTVTWSPSRHRRTHRRGPRLVVAGRWRRTVAQEQPAEQVLNSDPGCTDRYSVVP